MFGLVVASSARAGPVRATATTGAPASANATAIPRPRPRLAPTTTVVLPDKSLMVVLFLFFACPPCLSLCLGPDGFCFCDGRVLFCDRRVLPFERLGRAAAPAVGHGL